jgi:hypothetical protein
MGTHMMQLSHGLGSISGDRCRPVENPAIDQYDNAWLLWYLTATRT